MQKVGARPPCAPGSYVYGQIAKIREWNAWLFFITEAMMVMPTVTFKPKITYGFFIKWRSCDTSAPPFLAHPWPWVYFSTAQWILIWSSLHLLYDSSFGLVSFLHDWAKLNKIPLLKPLVFHLSTSMRGNSINRHVTVIIADLKEHDLWFGKDIILKLMITSNIC